MAAEALHAGASGFVHAGLSPERIALAISLVLEGEGDPEATPRLPLGTVPLHEVAQALRLLVLQPHLALGRSAASVSDVI